MANETAITEVDKIIDVLREATGAVTGALSSAAPDVAAATLGAVQLGAIVSLMLGLCTILFLALVGFGIFKLVRYAEKANTDSVWAITLVSGGVYVLGGGIMLIEALIKLLSTYSWISAFNPAAGIAYRLISKVL